MDDEPLSYEEYVAKIAGHVLKVHNVTLSEIMRDGDAKQHANYLILFHYGLGNDPVYVAEFKLKEVASRVYKRMSRAAVASYRRTRGIIDLGDETSEAAVRRMRGHDE